MNYAIDDLRNPLITPKNCRGEPKTASTSPLSLSLTSTPQQLSLTFAISQDAAHIGPCALFIGTTQISSADDCISRSKTPDCIAVPGSITNDMCLLTYTFTLTNLAAVTCTDCVLRWTWKATHISIYSPELFETCMDVTISQPYNAPQAAYLTTQTPVAAMASATMNSIPNYHAPPILVAETAPPAEVASTGRVYAMPAPSFATAKAYGVPPQSSKKKCSKRKRLAAKK
jgi:hypothetical protein